MMVTLNTLSTVNDTPHNVAINPLNAELNPICHLLALLGGATIVVISKLRVKQAGSNGNASDLFSADT
jgi:hypothetical protein